MKDIEELERLPKHRPAPEEFYETQMIRIIDDLEQTSDTLEDLPVKEEVPDHSVEEPEVKKKPARRLNKFGRVFLQVVFVVSVATATYSGYQLYKGMKDYRESENAYAALADSTRSDKAEPVIPESSETPLSYEPANFTALSEINPDVAGWLSLADTVINYPVVRGSDNDYYLEHLFTGEVNHTGCIFIDYRNAKDFSDRNTVLYAHHMRNGSMFAELEGYRSQDYYESHPELILQTPDGLYLVQPFAGLLTSGDAGYIQLEFYSDEEFLGYVNEMRAQSTFQSNVEVTSEDRIITMSTCRYDVENGRYAVFAKLVPVN
ncbi:MAG: class B sortase [Solobacterium sp.]|nr:class B sortase [Solobacterium sp.]